MTARPSIPLLLETGFDLLVATLMLRIRPFESIMEGWRDDDGASEALAQPEADMLARALRAWNRRLPWRTECFEQGLAAMRFVRRRGCHATLHYGARSGDGALEAHVWVTSRGRPVVGCGNAADFRELQRYPADQG